MKNKIIFILGIYTILLISGCSTITQTEPKKDLYGLDVYSSYDGDLMHLDSESVSIEYNGRTYYFKNKNTANLFQDNPQNYILKYDLNQKPKNITPDSTAFGLRTNCSYNGDPIVVSEYTPTLEYMGRIYYFAHNEEMIFFIENPQLYIAKYPANKIPSIISPLKADYGEKTACATSGTSILVGPHTPALEYLGRVFYFTSLQNMYEFKRDPQLYIAKKFNQQ